jgi:pterin-4a-carbinolamine dehydratase
MSRAISGRFFSRGYDPTARIPTKKCDPYGQDGKPLDYTKAMELLQTLDTPWRLVEVVPGSKLDTQRHPTTTYLSLYREFYHETFIHGSRFLAMIAAVAQNNNHFPEISLQRQLVNPIQGWQVISSVQCFTPTLKGLSYHDFHLALMIDVEVARPEYQRLLTVKKEAR